MTGPDPLHYGWWLASRSAGIVSILAVSVSVIIGLMMANGLPRKNIIIWDRFDFMLKDAGFTVEKNAYQVNNQTAGGTVTAKNGGDKGEVAVMVGAQGGKTSITITHSNK